MTELISKARRRQLLSNERTRRWRARQRGEAIPKQKPGVPRGYQQTPEHREKRRRASSSGSLHHSWKGDNIVPQSGRGRALKMYPEAPCEICGVMPGQRHHIDGNPINNNPDNIKFLCPKCHTTEDGRRERFRKLTKDNQPKACAISAALRRNWREVIAPLITSKTCTRCLEQKDIGSFGVNKSMRDGHSIYCRSCVSTINRRRHERMKSKHPEIELTVVK